MNSKKIKVLFRLRSLEMGGVPYVVLDLLRNLPKDKFEFTLLVNLFQGELRTEVPQNIRFVALGKGREDLPENPLVKKFQLISRRIKLEFFKTFPTVLYRTILKEKYDLEVAPTYSDFESILNSPDKTSRKIGWFHTDVSYDKDKNRVWKRINLMKKFDWMIFGSAQTRQVIEDIYGVHYPNSSVIYNVIKIDEAREKSKRFQVRYETHPVFSSVGRLHPRKGYDLLMKVHKRLLDEGFTHSISIVGGGSEMENLKSQAKQLDVENTFVLQDTQLNPYPYVAAADYFILPSRSESYPLIIGEVFGLEKPIISTNVGGISEMIEDGVDGILVNFDEDEIYEAMKKFLTDENFIRKLTENVSKSYRKFDNEKIYQQVTEVFEKQFQLKNEPA